MFWIIVIGIVIYLIVKKTKETEREHLESIRRKMEEIEREKKLAEEQAKRKAESKNFQINKNSDLERAIKELKPHWIWMSLAGGTNPILTPLIHFEPNSNSITLTKKGYDLWTENLKKYYNGTVWEEREQALKKFEKDLFGEYAGQLGISIEYIAHHLIKLENERTYESDFTLTFSTVVDPTVFENRSYFYEQVSQTPFLKPSDQDSN